MSKLENNIERVRLLGQKEVSDIVTRALMSPMGDGKEEEDLSGVSCIEAALYRSVRHAALVGDWKTINSILDRVIGKPVSLSTALPPPDPLAKKAKWLENIDRKETIQGRMDDEL